MADTLKSIEGYLTDYFLRGESMNIDELLNVQDKLSIHSYRLAEMAAESKGTYNNNVFSKKISVNKQTQELLNKGISKAAATVQAENSNEEMIKAELDAGALAYKLDLLLGQVNRVLNSMQQRISYLKFEHQKTNP